MEIVETPKEGKPIQIDFSKTVLVDFADLLVSLKPGCLKYFNLSEQGDYDSAMYHLYSVLRDAENVEGADNILLANLENTQQTGNNAQLHDTIYDKLYRSSAGKKLFYNKETNKIYE